MKVTHIELDQRVYLKAKIRLMSDKLCVKIIEPPWDNRMDVFNKVNNAWLKELRKEKQIKE